MNKGNKNESDVCTDLTKWTSILHFRNPQSGANHNANKLMGAEDIASVLPTHFNVETKNIATYKRKDGLLQKGSAVGGILRKVALKTNGKIPLYIVRRNDLTVRRRLYDVYLPAYMESILKSFSCPSFCRGSFDLHNTSIPFIGIESRYLYKIDYVELFYCIEFLIEAKIKEFGDLDDCKSPRFIPDAKEDGCRKLLVANSLFGFKSTRPSFFNTTNKPLKVNSSVLNSSETADLETHSFDYPYLSKKLHTLDYVIIDTRYELILTHRTLTKLFPNKTVDLLGYQCRELPCRMTLAEAINRSNLI